MAKYKRTYIRRLIIEGYRSISHLELRDIPPLVVLYGPNGAGKSNILRAVNLLICTLSKYGREVKWTDPIVIDLMDADRLIGLRPADFLRGHDGIRISIDICLGDKVLTDSKPYHLDTENVHIDGLFQYNRATRRIIFTLKSATIGDDVSLIPVLDEGAKVQIKYGDYISSLKNTRDSILRRLEGDDDRNFPPSNGILSHDEVSELKSEMSLIDEKIYNAEEEMKKKLEIQKDLSNIRYNFYSKIVTQLVQLSGAYRVPESKDSYERSVYELCLSEDKEKRDSIKELSSRLQEMGLLNSEPSFGSVSITPIDSVSYDEEKQFLINSPVHGELPLRNFGSGQQQIVMILAQSIITPYPIAFIEEPEAHLHVSLMGPLSKVLRSSVLDDDSGLDQMWIATHHRYFNIYFEFFDVSLDNKGSTKVDRRPRDEAALHFYEPSPYIDTLRSLVEEFGEDPETVLLGGDGNEAPITIKDVLDSFDGDQQLASEFVSHATKAFVLSLIEEGKGK